MSTGYPCFDLSGVACINQSQLLIYKQAWYDYTRIQLYNSNVSTLHFQGMKNIPYYQYVNYSEQQSFTQGQFLHSQVFPSSNWAVVQEN